MKEIVFTLGVNESWIREEDYPSPASKHLPDWYKKMENFVGGPTNGEERRNSQTMKRCMPLFDSMTTGYYLKTYTDLTVKNDKEKGLSFSWAYSTNSETVSFHHAHQVIDYKDKSHPFGAPKLFNPWGIQTPAGYSVLIIPPLHQPAIGIRILEAVVDTDKYYNQIQFPFAVDEGFTGDIPIGTPFAQIIPFKRDDFKMRIGGDNERMAQKPSAIGIRSVFTNGYRNLYRTRKKYI